MGSQRLVKRLGKLGLTHVLRNSHLITTSTDELADQISIMFKGKIRIMRNTGINQQREKQGVQLDKIQVGWTGDIVDKRKGHFIDQRCIHMAIRKERQI